MGEVTSHNISESTRLTYTQVPQTAGSAFYTFCSDAYIMTCIYVTYFRFTDTFRSMQRRFPLRLCLTSPDKLFQPMSSFLISVIQYYEVYTIYD